jgi:hypothetical protein
MTEQEFDKLGMEILALIHHRTTTKDGEWITSALFRVMVAFFLTRMREEGKDRVDLLIEFLAGTTKIIQWFLNSGDDKTDDKMLATLQDATASMMDDATKH